MSGYTCFKILPRLFKSPKKISPQSRQIIEHNFVWLINFVYCRKFAKFPIESVRLSGAREKKILNRRSYCTHLSSTMASTTVRSIVKALPANISRSLLATVRYIIRVKTVWSWPAYGNIYRKLCSRNCHKQWSASLLQYPISFTFSFSPMRAPMCFILFLFFIHFKARFIPSTLPRSLSQHNEPKPTSVIGISADSNKI